MSEKLNIWKDVDSKFDLKKILNKFYEEYQAIVDSNFNMGGMRDANEMFEWMFDTNRKGFVYLVQDLVKERKDSFDSTAEKSALMFALDDLRILDYFD